MLLALLSDTHDNRPSTEAAIGLLAAHHPDVYLHAGDVVSPDMLSLFAGLPFHFVFGNNEYDLSVIRATAAALDLHCHDYAAILTFDDKKIALTHGHDNAPLARLLTLPGQPQITPDYLVHGHTHVRRDERLATNTRIINPGAVHRAKPRSVALLNLQADTLTFLEVPSL